MFRDFVNLITGLAWPAAVVYLLGWRFRDPVARLIDRTREIGPGGARMDQPTGLDPRESPKQLENASAIQQSAKGNFTPLFQALVNDARKFVDGVVGHDLVSRENAMLWLYARASVNTAHEKNYRIIFGSQIAAMRFLNQSRTASVTTLQPFYDAAVKANPTTLAEYSYEAWVGFLFTSGLIEKDAAGAIKLTEAGLDFLQYITASGYSEHRML